MASFPAGLCFIARGCTQGSEHARIHQVGKMQRRIGKWAVPVASWASFEVEETSSRWMRPSRGIQETRDAEKKSRRLQAAGVCWSVGRARRGAETREPRAVLPRHEVWPSPAHSGLQKVTSRRSIPKSLMGRHIPHEQKEVALNVKDRLIHHYTGISERSTWKTFRETGEVVSLEHTCRSTAHPRHHRCKCELSPYIDYNLYVIS